MDDNKDESLEKESINLTRHKIVFVGDVAVGKTSIISRLIENKYKENYEASIGVDFCSKNLRCHGKTIKLQIWDSAGQEKYKSIIPTYIRNSSIIYIVFDLSKKETFNSVTNWISFVKNYANCVIILCGNKLDLEKKVESSEAQSLANKEGLFYFEVSAKTNENIKNMFYSSVAELPIFDDIIDGKNKKNLIHELEQINETQVHDAMDSLPKEVRNLGVYVRNKKITKSDNNCKC